MFEDIKILLDNEMYEDAKSLGGFYVTMLENERDIFLTIDAVKLYYYWANAHYFTHEHKKAENLYSKALDLTKRLSRSSSRQKSGDSEYNDLPSDVELKWNMYLCNSQLRTYKDGQAVLESIPSRKRTAKINMALGNIYMRQGNESGAISSFKEVLKEIPHSIEASRNLLHLGVQLGDIVDIMQLPQTNTTKEGLPDRSNFQSPPPKVSQTSLASQRESYFKDLMSYFLKAHVYSASRVYPTAIQEFEWLDGLEIMRGNVNILAELGEVYYAYGDYEAAERVLARVHDLDRQCLRHMDIYADLLQRKNKLAELEKVALKLLHVTEHRSEPWIAFGYLCYAGNRIPRSLYFAQKAFMLNGHCLHSLLLKGYALLKSNKIPEAMAHFLDARRIAPRSFEALKGGVQCYLARKQFKDAILKAQEIVDIVGQSPRTMTFLGKTFLKEESHKERGRVMFEIVLKKHPHYLDAIYALADVYMKTTKVDDAIKLLKTELEHQQTSLLHERLGECLRKTGERVEAIEQFNLALAENPSNERLKDIVSSLEQDDADDVIFDDDDITDPDWSD